MANDVSFYKRLRSVLKKPSIRYAIPADRPSSAFQQRLHNQFLLSSRNLYQQSLAGSTERYARVRDYELMDTCLNEDTKIITLYGLNTIKELSEMYPNGEKFIVYSYDHNKQQIVPACAHNARKTRTDHTYKIIFDDDSFLIATANHPIMLRDGTYKRVDELLEGDSCMPFYRKQFYKDNPYRFVYTTNNDVSVNGWISEHRYIAEWYYNRKIKQDECVHHIDFNKENNDPTNLFIMKKSDHKKLHAKLINEARWKDPVQRHNLIEKLKNAANKRWSNIEERIKWSESRKGEKNPFYGKHHTEEMKAYLVNKLKEFNTGRFHSEETINKMSNSMKLKWKNDEYRLKQLKNFKILSKEKQQELNELQNKLNHKVKKIEYYGVEDVYDLTVDGYENFATDTVFVHNSSPICSLSLNTFSDNASQIGDQGLIVNIKSDFDSIKQELEILYYDILNLDYNCWHWIRNMTKYGDSFLLLDVLKDEGITSYVSLPTIEIEREEGFDNDVNSVRFKWTYNNGATYENFQIAHFRIKGDDTFLPYGRAILEPARRPWKQYNLVFDAMLSYRISRAPERRVFYVDTGNIQPNDISQFMQRVRDQLKRQPLMDQTTGNQDLRYNAVPLDDDYYIPVRGDSKTRIETLPGATNLGDIEDVKLIRCLRSDTKIKLLNGYSKTIKEIVDEQNFDNLWTMSVNQKTLELEPTKIISAKKTRLNAQLLRVNLDNEKYVDCTPDHLFMMKNGTYKQAQHLQVNDSLMPCYTKISDDNSYIKGYEMMYNPGKDRYDYTHQIVGKAKYPGLNSKHNIIHHCNFNKLDNSFDNLLYIENGKIHQKLHAELNRINKNYCGNNNPNYRKDLTKDKIIEIAKECESFDELCDKLDITRQSAIFNRFDNIKKEDFIKLYMSNIIEKRRNFKNINITIDEIKDVIKENNFRKLYQIANYYNVSFSYIKNIMITNSYDDMLKLRFDSFNISKDELIEAFRLKYNSNELAEKFNFNIFEFKRFIKYIGYKNIRDFRIKNNVNFIKKRKNKVQAWNKNKTKETNESIKQGALKLSKVAKLRTREKNPAFVNNITIKDLAINFSLNNNLSMQKLGKSIGHSKMLISRILKDNNITWDEFKKDYSNYYEHNHKVISIEWLNEKEDTYDIQVSLNSNFMLDAGVFIHNSELIAALGIPSVYVDDAELGMGRSMGAQQDLQFARSVQRIQKAFLSELTKLGIIHLYAKGYSTEQISSFSLSMTPPSAILEMQKLEVFDKRFTIYSNSTRDKGISRRWAQKYILNLSNDEIAIINKEIENDAKLISKINTIESGQVPNTPFSGADTTSGTPATGEESPLAVPKPDTMTDASVNSDLISNDENKDKSLIKVRKSKDYLTRAISESFQNEKDVKDIIKNLNKKLNEQVSDN